MNKILSLKDCGKLIQDGMTVAIGGNVLHRSPSALVREIVRQGKRRLKIIKTAGALDVDMLSLGKNIESVDAGFISYETKFGLAPFYRKAAQSGEIRVNEHACYTVISALIAGKNNIPFMPVKGLINSDLIEAHDYFEVIKDPFTGQDITVVKAIKPDYTIIHVQECDNEGNAIIKGPIYDDVLMAKAADNIIITTERIISKSQLNSNFDKVVIPGFLVKAIAIVKGGAKPCSCEGHYDIDPNKINEFLNIRSTEEYNKYLKTYEPIDYSNKTNFDIINF